MSYANKRFRVNLPFHCEKTRDSGSTYEEDGSATLRYAGIKWEFRMNENNRVVIRCNANAVNNFWSVHCKFAMGYKAVPKGKLPPAHDPMQIPAFNHSVDVTFNAEKKIVAARMKLPESQVKLDKDVMDDKYIVLDVEILSIKGHNSNPQQFIDSRDPNVSHDRVLVFPNGKLYVSSQYLCMWSEYFNILLNQDSHFHVEKQEIEIKDADMYEFAEMLDVIYPSMKPVDDSNIESLLYLADRYLMPSLFSFCSRFLNSRHCHINLFEKFRWAKQYILTDVYDDCLRELRQINLKDFLEQNKGSYEMLEDAEKEIVKKCVEDGPSKRCRCDPRDRRF